MTRRSKRDKKKRQIKKTQKKMAQHVPTGVIPVVDHQNGLHTHWTQKWMQFSNGFKELMIGVGILAIIVLGGILIYQGEEPLTLLELLVQVR